MDYKTAYENLYAQNSILLKQLNQIKETVADRIFSSDGSYFEAIVKKINVAINADYTFIGQKINNSIETISIYGASKILDGVSFELRYSPCKNILNSKFQAYTERVTDIFPKDILLKKLEIESLVGIPFFNSKKECAGILVSLFKKPLTSTIFIELLFSIYATDVGAEWEHEVVFNELKETDVKLKMQNEEYLALNEELSDNFNLIQNINQQLEETQEKLQENEAKYELLFENAGTANAYFGLDGKLIFQNTLSARFLNAEPGDFNGQSAIEIFGNDMGNKIMELFQQVKNTKQGLTFISDFNLPTGVKWFKNVYQPVFNAKKVVLGIHVISQEITKEKEAELKLIESEKKYSSVVETTTDLITKVDNEGKFVFVNHASKNIYGLEPEECMGRSVFDFIHPDDKEKTQISFNEWADSSETHFTFENRQIHKNGTNRPMYWNILVNRDENGRIINFASIARDVTELKELTEELIKAKLKAEESDRLKTSFLSNMSHEIRTPMNAILGFTELLAKKDLPEDKKAYFADIVKSNSQQLLSIISDIIDISKIEIGEFNLSITTFETKRFFDEIDNQSKLFLKQKQKGHIKLIKKIGPGVEKITSDKNRLSQILLNLLTNAIKFTETGEIEFGIGLVENNKIRLYVKDTGVGIDESAHDLIFQRFRQASEEDSFKGGTGLGLAICKMLTDKLKGEINIFSELGKGAVFEVVIPALIEDSVISTHEKNRI